MVFRIHRLNPSPLNGNGDSSYLKASNCQIKNIYKDFTNLSLDEIYGPQKKAQSNSESRPKDFSFPKSFPLSKDLRAWAMNFSGKSMAA